MDPRKVTDFPFSKLFLCRQDRRSNLSSLHAEIIAMTEFLLLFVTVGHIRKDCFKSFIFVCCLIHLDNFPPIKISYKYLKLGSLFRIF